MKNVKYTIGNKWVLRNDKNYNAQFTLYNVNNNILIRLNEALYSVIKIFYYSAISINELNGFFVQKGIEFDWEQFMEIWDKYRSYDLLIESNHSFNQNVEYEALVCNSRPRLVPIMSSPCDAEIHFTHNCNLRCLHCFQESDFSSDKNTHITAEQWIEIFDQFEQLRMQNITISGGEPMIYPKFIEVFRHAVYKRISLMVLTNAMLVTENMLPLLNAPNVILSISVDGHNADTHEVLRGKGSFRILDRNLSLLKKENVKFNLSFTIHKKNYKYIEDFIAYARGKDIDYVSFGFIEPSGRAEINNWLLLTNDELKEAQMIFDNIVTKYSDMTIEMPDITAPEESIIENDIVYCAAGTRRIAIRSDGVMFPCISAFNYNELAIGDLKVDKIRDLWCNDRWESYRGGISVMEIESCCDCLFRYKCNYRNCRIKTYGNKKSLYEKPKYCHIDRLV